jgi:hypothetical protein
MREPLASETCFKPLEERDFQAAAALLSEGFPQHQGTFWNEGLERLRRYADNASCGVPLGQLLIVKGEPVGVALTPASLRHDDAGKAYRLINFSSWYLKPEHRWRAAMMFRHVVADKDATYLDLTPAPHVQPMLPLFGFRPMSVGSECVWTPLWALRSSRGAKVREFCVDDPLPVYAPPAHQLLVHNELGCHPLILEHDQGTTLFVYRRRVVRHIPTARLKYVGDHAVLRQHLPALSRYFMARGFGILGWDARPDWPVPAHGWRKPANVWYARGHIPHNCTDFIGTELCLLGI